MRSIHQNILEQIRSGSKTVLATIISTSGSTPQKPGSSALFGKHGLLSGTIGGGMLEAEVQHIAESVLISGASDQFYFNLDGDVGDDGAICGGEAGVLVDADPSVHLSCLEKMEQSLTTGADGFLFTVVRKKHEEGKSIKRYWLEGDGKEDFPGGIDAAFKELVEAHLKEARRYGFAGINLESLPDQQLKMAYLEHIKPMPHLVIVGGGHVGKALAHLGALLEFEVSVVDDRPEFASRGHIPDADHLVVKAPGQALKEINPTPDTYVVIVTRGHRHDGEALRACIGSEAAFIGMIGSRHKVGIIKKQFLEEGWATPEQWSAIHAPIGLPIGSQTVQEITISIAAQLVEVRSRINKTHGE